MSSIRKRKVFSALEVAKICGVVNQTVINWIRANHLKSSMTPGGQFRVYPDDLKAFLVSKNMRIPDVLAQILSQDAPESLVVVEDDRVLNDVISAQLKRSFADVVILQAFDGFQAGTLLSAQKPKAVLLDINLPGIDGHELCRRIKSDPAFGNPLVLAFSASDDPNTERNILADGADAFFKKPLDADRLAAVLRTKLRW